MLRAIARRASSIPSRLPPLLGLNHQNPPRFPPPLHNRRGLSSAAEAVSFTDAEEGTDFQGFIEQEVEWKETLSSAFAKPKSRRSNRKQNVPAGMSASAYLELKRRQIKIETEEWEKAAEEYRDLLREMCEQKMAPNIPFVKTLFMGWFPPLRDRIAQEQEQCSKGMIHCERAPYMGLLPADKMAVVTMHKVMAGLMTQRLDGAAPVAAVALDLAEAIEFEAKVHRFMAKTRKERATDEEGDGEATKEQMALRKKVNNLVKRQKLYQVKLLVQQIDPSKPWSRPLKVKVGARLIELLLETAYVQPPVSQSGDDNIDIRPAFSHKSLYITREDVERGAEKYGVILCDPLVRGGLERMGRHIVIPYMPMLVPPLNWIGYNKGGYFFLPSSLMRTRGSKQQREAIKRASRQQLQTVFEALDMLGNTKWRINKRILDVVERIWSSGSGLAGLVDREDLPLPEKPDTEDVAEIKKWRREMRSTKKENKERHSQRCLIELKLAAARKLKDEEAFYYPHNLDFRGRAYPMHPYLNHLGDDVSRGILEFAEGRPLGKSGLHWLKIHLANLYGGGVDKLAYEGRIAFTENHIEDVFDSADRPLEGRRWWLSAEDPFQCLAVCFNLAEALRSPCPENTISHLPVHQDGSCNGLQHYAALGRDKLGAAAVNLVAGETPADVYTRIAERVLWMMQADAEKDPAIDPNALYAKFLLDQVDRKFVKQTVMTSVYGITFVGARDQLMKRLLQRGFIDDHKNELFKATCYAAKVILMALGEMFQSAREIMNWLGDCAKVIAMENHDVRWISPIGLPVVQPYRKSGLEKVRTTLQDFALRMETDQVLVGRQKTAFPPNFVHSLDGSHMMMTAAACKKAGLNFAGVHDSYWTHACDVDVMNQILREKFVELYSAPILENLLEYFKKTFPKLHFPDLPERGDFDLKEVLHSTYFFN